MSKSSKRSDVVAASHFVNSGEANKRDAEEEIEQKLNLKKNKFDEPKTRDSLKRVKAVDVSCSELRTETNISPAKKLNLEKNKFFKPNLSLALKPFHQISYDEFRTKTTVAAAGSAKLVKITKSSKTITASNLSISVDKSHVIDFFKQVGDIVDVRIYLYKHNSGQLRAHFAYIEFATEEAANKAKKFHRLDLHWSSKKKKLVMKDIPYNTDKSDVIKFFKQAGDIVDVCFFFQFFQHFCRADEYSRSAHIEFVSEEAERKAEKLNGVDLLGSCVGLCRQVKGTGAPKTVCLKNVPLIIDKSHVIDFFEDVGDVADVRFSYDKYGTFRGIVHVEFATEEAAKEAVKWNGKDLKGCPVELGIVRETVCVQGFDTSSDQIQRILKRHFRTCRYIVHIDILKDHNTGVPLGTALINFSCLEAFHLALELDVDKKLMVRYACCRK
ncbi:hypothetical protein MKW98_021427 [Papaver atlanticum]|uniref:RRM domain-containing protein n=1 Tax=Papaver atlanticum TaxID=357466 RepID=A0AAD4SRE0_9MAGN|nr:hypothetical protein MKW98_021427 [Papaver atlanticum]